MSYKKTLFALMALVVPMLGATPATQPAVEKQRFVILYVPGSNWVAGKPIWDQPLQAHGEYMHQLYTRHTLFMGGPLTDSTGGLAIVDVVDEKEAQAVVDHDPAVKAGVFKATVHPWYPVDWQNFGK